MKLRPLVPSTQQGGGEVRSGAMLFGPLHREIDRLFDDFARVLPSHAAMPMNLLPSIDVAESDQEIDVSVEMPGLERRDVDISLEDNVLTIRGEKKLEANREKKNVFVRERAYGNFLRTIELPAGIDSSKISATMSDGVLRITIPKPASTEAKKIEVKEGKGGKGGQQSEPSQSH
ncbi:Hsp20/alpha crystallin family protein [Hyphomicrobium sp.]|uniref:Hsp20/alpha crystallin family protein n=1 Tax=Hyphomicrobium sp. TaxID=82 RepID=UPI002D77DCEF|nr:Hsp20/alpha crystallin family protein [Hyphomicrobium sp.]HET6389223.1 Hsp20/alpha crystallin family protein [Hyphomicrobium sp.]